MAGQAGVGEWKPKIHSPKWPFTVKYLPKSMENQRGTLNQHKRPHPYTHHTAVPRFQVDPAARSPRKARELTVFLYIDGRRLCWNGMNTNISRCLGV